MHPQTLQALLATLARSNPLPASPAPTKDAAEPPVIDPEAHAPGDLAFHCEVGRVRGTIRVEAK